MEQNSPDWEISKLYSRAFEIVKKHKLLWILGLAAAGGGFNYRSSGNFDSKTWEKFFPNPQTPNPPSTEIFNNILGATTSPFFESAKAIFGSIPFYFYLVLVLEILVLMIMGIIISVIYQAWVQGLLIQSTFDASADQKVSISASSAKVLARIRPLIWLQVVPGLVFSLVSALVFAILAISIAVVPGIAKTVPVILIIVAVGALIYWLIHLTLAQIWAPRKVLAENMAGKEAFFSGLKIAKKKLWPSLLLGAVNNILSLFVIGVPVAILIGLVVGSVFAAKFTPGLEFLLILVALPLALTLIIGFSLLGGALGAFKAVDWTLAYENIKGKYD